MNQPFSGLTCSCCAVKTSFADLRSLSQQHFTELGESGESERSLLILLPPPSVVGALAPAVEASFHSAASALGIVERSRSGSPAGSLSQGSGASRQETAQRANKLLAAQNCLIQTRPYLIRKKRATQGFEMFVKMFTVGMLGTNCYLIGDKDSGEAAIIDAGFDAESEAQHILDEVERNGLQIKYIINTHGHPDHNGGNSILKNHSHAPILIHEADAPMLNSPPADRRLREGDIIEIGDVKLKVIHTPGHSLGSIALFTGDYVFSGDTLFAGSIGRYDLPGASLEELVNSLKKLCTLPDHVKVCPGHGPVTTIGEERGTNPFLQNFNWVAFG